MANHIQHYSTWCNQHTRMFSAGIGPRGKKRAITPREVASRARATPVPAEGMAAPATKTTWTNPSVLRFAKGADPVAAIIERARRAVLDAMDNGWSGPPFDPLRLAQLLKLDVAPREDVRDARMLATTGGRLRIEFNPNRSRGRVNYSLAHEIAHTFFEDCADRVRHRGHHEEGVDQDAWQLEALCNIAASELLMPTGSLPKATLLDIDTLLRQRAQFDVSAEALFLRMVQITDEAYAAFCASPAGRRGSYRVDYVIGSAAWCGPLARGAAVPSTSVVHDCTAIGFTAKADEAWGHERVRIECVGLPPYPGAQLPRVLGLARPTRRMATQPALTFLRGDATRPRGTGTKVIVQVVNDATANWGGSGFVQAVRRRWPHVQEDFRTWVSEAGSRSPQLGSLRIADAEEGIHVASLVAQHGYGPSSTARIRYRALKEGLQALAAFCAERQATAHMPRIGCGQAGGSWDVVEELLHMTLGTASVP